VERQADLGTTSARRARPALALTIASALVALALLAIPRLQATPASAQTAAQGSAAACPGSHWVGAWQAAPQSSSIGHPDDAFLGLADGRERTFVDQTLRIIVTPHVGGSAIRVHITNRYGASPLVVDAATLARRATGSSLVAGSMRALRFGGSPVAIIPAGQEAISDPVEADVHPFESLGVSYHVAGPAALDYHQWAQTTNYVTAPRSGDHTASASGAAYTERLTSSYGVTRIDVLAPRSVGAVVAVGDSITDGIGSSPNANRRWPDELTRRVDHAGASLSVVNAGIAGNHVATDGLTSAFAIGPSAEQRLPFDALHVDGVTDVFVYEGINDIFMSGANTDPATRIIAGYQRIIDAGHRAGLRVVGATITPAGMTGLKEAARQEVNAWIRTSGAYDAVVDFDSVVRDPASPARVLPRYDAALAHLTDTGYKAEAGSIPLDIFHGTGC
jgi:lysophospholipase L1-like esterase